MHFYDFNIGDYAKKTQHLTNEEDLAYRRLLDMYYDTEKPIANPSLNGGIATLSRRLRVSEQALKNVLDEFFPDGKNKHADEKIASYYAFIAQQSANGKRGGRPKHKDVKPIANPPITQALPTDNPSPNQPLPTNHYPLTKELKTQEALKQKQPNTRKRGSAISIQTFLDECDAKGERRIPESDPVFDVAEQIGITLEMVKVCWQEFVRTHSESGKKQTDWRATFRNYVRKNYYKLWYVEADGSVKETPQYRALKKVGEAHAQH